MGLGLWPSPRRVIPTPGGPNFYIAPTPLIGGAASILLDRPRAPPFAQGGPRSDDTSLVDLVDLPCASVGWPEGELNGGLGASVWDPPWMGHPKAAIWDSYRTHFAVSWEPLKGRWGRRC